MRSAARAVPDVVNFDANTAAAARFVDACAIAFANDADENDDDSAGGSTPRRSSRAAQ